jgi:hypothetical protein
MESQMIRAGHLTAHQTARQLGIGLDGVRQLQRSGGSPRQPWYAVQDVTALVIKRATRKAA